MKQIFLVEDDEGYSELIRLVLEQRGFSCNVAYTLAQARKRLAAHEADLIILDGHLPDGSGLDLCAELRRDPRFAKAMIVILLLAEDAQRRAHRRTGRRSHAPARDRGCRAGHSFTF